MKKICIFTSTRADLGILKPLIEELLSDKNNFSTELFVTGTHLDPKYGHTFNEIANHSYPVAAMVPFNSSELQSQNHSISMANAIIAFEIALSSLPNYDLAIILGDRFEALSFAITCYNRRIPIAHIHGGETTHGSLDEGYRHSITKLSNLHFPCAQIYAERIIQMGEHRSHVFNVGSLSLDSINNLELFSKNDFEEFLEEPIKSQIMLITFHPETCTPDFGLTKLESLITALSEKDFSDWTLIVTGTNNDQGSGPIRECLEKWCASDGRIIFKESLGQKGYFSAITFSKIIIGNSSSGILEVPHFKKPTLNIGTRQEGRSRVPSIIDDIGHDPKSIYLSIKKALNLSTVEFDISFGFYGKGDSAKKICSILKKINYS